MKKPPRLRMLILSLVVIGLIVAIKGLADGLGIWTTGTLACFFAAHLLGIPHNSGRYWAAFIALGLFAIAAARLAAHFEIAGFHSSNSLPFVLSVGIPLLYIMTALLILVLSIHSSVCEYFDLLDSSQPESRLQKRSAERAVHGNTH